MKTQELLYILSREWPSPNCAFIPEFRSGTGFAREQRADAIAMHLWPSKGLKLIGFELKVSRSDWLHEMNSPNKSDHMKQFCDEWYLVVSDLKIVKYAQELPRDWGLMYVEDGKIRILIESKKLLPIPIDRLILASLMRRATKK